MSARRWFAGAVLGMALAAPCARGEAGSAQASTPGDCRPRPAAFHVPAGFRAARFQILSLGPGTRCAGATGGAVAGFSIRRGGATVFLHYRETSGRVVWDPVPLSDLALPEGDYSLLAAPASGASVALAWELQPAG